MKISQKILFPIIIFLLLSTLITSIYLILHEKKILFSEFDKRAQCYLNAISISCEYPILIGNQKMLEDIGKSMLKQEDIISCKITANGNILFQGGLIKEENYREYSIPIYTKTAELEKEDVIIGISPEKINVEIGRIQAVFTTYSLIKEISKLSRNIIIFSIFGIIIVSIFIIVELTNTIIKPVENLYNATEEIVRGNLDFRIKIPHIPCWKIKKCNKKDCISYESKDIPCWYVSSAMCHEVLQEIYDKKIDDCHECEIYQKYSGDEINRLAQHFNLMTSEIQKRQQDLQKSREWLETTLKSIGDAVIATNAKGDIVFMNTVASELTGWNRQEVIGKPIKEIFNIIHEKTKKPIENPVEKIIKEGIIVGLGNHALLISKDGKEIPIDDSGAPIKNNMGDTTGIVLIFRDVTSRRKREKKLHLLSFSVQQAIEGIAVSDMDGNLLFVNNSFASMCGYNQEELIGKNFSTLHTPEQMPAVETCCRQVKEKGSFKGEIWYLRRGGVVFPGLMHNSLLKDEDNPIGMTMTLIDITRQKQDSQKLKHYSEKLESVNEELEAFTYTAAHDLKEPLRAIEIFSQFILEDYSDKFDNKAKDYFNRIIANTERMTKLIESLLAISRISKEYIPYTMVNSKKLVENAVKRLEAIIIEKKAKINIPDKLPVILCNTKFEEVFYNVIYNAVKYNDNPEPVVEVGVLNERQQTNDEEFIVFYVRDNGIGIKKEYFERIFNIFERLHEHEAYGGGAGAGLAIVKKIIGEHKGKIWVESEQGKGSTFFFIIPV